MRYFEITDTITGSTNYLTEGEAINKLGLVQFDLAYGGLVKGVLVLETDQATYDLHKLKTLKEFTLADNFKKLVIKYADGRKVCNCGEAYETPCGKGFVDSKYRTDLMICESGCSANQIAAKEYVAKRVLEDLGE